MNRAITSVLSGLVMSFALQAIAEEKAAAATDRQSASAPQGAVSRYEGVAFCFETSRLCVARKPKEASAPAAALKLGIPKDQLLAVAARVNANVADTDEDGLSAVQVRGQRTTTPEIPSGLGSLIWAAKNPSQAWRIFLPATAE